MDRAGKKSPSPRNQQLAHALLLGVAVAGQRLHLTYVCCIAFSPDGQILAPSGIGALTEKYFDDKEAPLQAAPTVVGRLSRASSTSLPRTKEIASAVICRSEPPLDWSPEGFCSPPTLSASGREFSPSRQRRRYSSLCMVLGYTGTDCRNEARNSEQRFAIVLGSSRSYGQSSDISGQLMRMPLPMISTLCSRGMP